MTSTVLRAVRFMETRIDKLRDDQEHIDIRLMLERLEEALKFVFFLTGPILLPIIIMYMEINFR